MSKEKKVRKHKVLNHPIAALFLLLLWGMTFYQVFGVITQGLLGVNFTGFGAAVGAVIALFIHKAWFSPEFKGAVGKPGFRAKDVKIAFVVFAVMLILMDIANFFDLAVCIVICVIGLYLIRSSKRTEICALWDKKWHRTDNAG